MHFKCAAFTVMTPEYTLEETAGLLRDLGFDGVEWRVHSVPTQLPAEADFWRGNKATVDIGSIGKTAKDIRKLSEDHGLEIVGLGTYLSYRLLDDVERCMDAARTMGCQSIRVSPPKYDGSENYNDLFEEAIDGYGRVEKLAKEYNVRANIEIRQGSICSSASLCYRLVSEFDPDLIGVIVDPGNMIFEGCENWQLGLELLGPYLAYVHVKNCAWFESGVTNEGEKQWKASVVPMKEGMVFWPQFLSALDKVGYKGWLSFEDFAVGDTKTKLAQDITYMKSVESQLGI